MSVVTIIWSMIASACLTLAIIYLLVWYRNRAAWAYLFFSLTAVATTGLAFCELWRMRAGTPAEMLLVMTVLHVPLFVWLVSVTWFVYFYLGAGRFWLAWLIVGLRTVSLVGNLVLGQNTTFREVTSLQHITFLGEQVSILGAVPNTLTPLTQFGSFLVLVFVADAAMTAWSRGERRKAVMIGGSVEFFVLLGLGQAAVALWLGVRIPVTFSVPYLGLVAVMAYELSREVRRASRLARELQASDAELRESERQTLALREEIAHAGRVSMLGQLSAALAHEINQPLGAIQLNADAANRFLNRPSPDLDEVRTILADISKETQRAGAVIDGMRNLLRRQRLEARPLDVAELVLEVSALVRMNAIAHHVSLSIDLPPGLPLVAGDRVHLQQVLLNLLLNGMDAQHDTPQPDRRIVISSRLVDAGLVEVGVADGGPGIPADQLAMVFEPFYTTKPKGMGMGLPISRTIIEAHGGRIWAENVAGRGAAFRFTLPIAETVKLEAV
jgi:signal transduction histidine kinase